MDGLGVLLGLGAFAIVGTIIMVILGAVVYVVNALAIKKYLTALGSNHTWAGWIPVYGNYEMFNVVADTDDESVLKRVFNINIEDKIAKWYPFICFAVTVVSSRVFDTYRTQVISSIISTICSVASLIGLSASLAVGFALIEDKDVKDTRVFAVVQSIIGILFWVKAFQISDSVEVTKRSTSREEDDIVGNVARSIENAASSLGKELNGSRKKSEDGDLVEEAVKKVRLNITSEFAENGGIKKIKVDGTLVKLEIPSNAKNKHKIYIEDYNSEGDDLEVTLNITE